jgi:hypothetical protein
MTNVNRAPRRDMVLNGGVRAAPDSRLPSSADPQTRLFWD